MLYLYLSVLFTIYSSSVNAQSFAGATSFSSSSFGLRLQPYTNPGYCNPKCNDDPPLAGTLRTNSLYSCEQQKRFGKCHSAFMEGYCECTCDKCCPCNNSPPPQSIFSCSQQRMFGKCNRGWMLGYCECECGRCAAVFEEEPDANGGATAVAEAAKSGTEDGEKINGDDTDGDDDGDDDGEEDTPSSAVTSTPTPIPTPTPSRPAPNDRPGRTGSVDTRVVVSGGDDDEVEEEGDDDEEEGDRECDEGEVPIPESRPFRCESARCARSRERCANRCGGFTEIEFECKLVRQGNSMSSSTACSCA